MLSHDVAVFKDVLAVDPNRHIATRPLDTAALPIPVLLTELVGHLPLTAGAGAGSRAVQPFVLLRALPLKLKLLAAHRARSRLATVKRVVLLM